MGKKFQGWEKDPSERALKTTNRMREIQEQLDTANKPPLCFDDDLESMQIILLKLSRYKKKSSTAFKKVKAAYWSLMKLDIELKAIEERSIPWLCPPIKFSTENRLNQEQQL